LSEWTVVEVKSLKSKDGADLKVQEDGSILATGKNGAFDVYTIVAETSTETISGIRLEALPHASLPKGGAGRAPNGNFALSDVKITVRPAGEPKAKAIELRLTN